MKRSDSVKELSTALSLVQGKIVDAKVDSKNPHFKSEYASLEAHLQAARQLLSLNGLAVTQGIVTLGTELFLETLLLHKSGEFITFEMPLILSKNDMQGLGSAITYARRYSLAALVGIGTEDDDGNAASIKQAPQGNKPPPQAIKPPVANAFVEHRAAQEELSEDPGLYTPKFGKFKDARLKDLDLYDLNNYVKYIYDSAKSQNKELQGNVLEFVEFSEAFLRSKEFSNGKSAV